MVNKRTGTIILAILLVLSLSGCDLIMRPEPTPEPTVEPIPTLDPTQAPTPTPLPTAEPTPEITPAPLAAADYAYESFSNKSLGVKFNYPTHWENVPGKNTISFVEQVGEGEIPARVAVSSSKLAKAPDAKKLKNEMSRFMRAIKKGYPTFSTGKLSTKAKMLKATGVSQTYTAETAEGKQVRGKVVIVYNKGKKKLFALHFSAAGERYPDLTPVADQIQTSLKIQN